MSSLSDNLMISVSRLFVTGPEAAPSTTYMIASRGHAALEPDRFFTGDVFEVIVYDRLLQPDEKARVQAYLESRWNVTDTDPKCTQELHCTPSAATNQSVAAARCLQIALAGNSTMRETTAFERAEMVQDYAAAFVTRCAMHKNGTLPLLPTSASTNAALDSYQYTISQLYLGMENMFARWKDSTDVVKLRLVAEWNTCTV